MKKLYTLLLCALLCAFLCVSAFANTAERITRDARDAVSTAIEEGKDLITDLKETVDPDGDGKPEAEGDGVVDGDTVGTTDDITKKDETTGRDTTDRDTTSRDTTNKTETTGVIEGMELEKNGINPWAIVIAVVVVIAVLVLVFILVPKRR